MSSTQTKGKHLVFYDGECGLCDRAVQFLIQHDKEKVFDFAPLKGRTAELWLNPPPAEDTLVLIENYKIAPKEYILSSAAFRSLILLDGAWEIPGMLYYLPSFIFNGLYRLIARNRHQIFAKDKCVLPDALDSSRYLP